jgi:hypothetical protein
MRFVAGLVIVVGVAVVALNQTASLPTDLSTAQATEAAERAAAPPATVEAPRPNTPLPTNTTGATDPAAGEANRSGERGATPEAVRRESRPHQPDTRPNQPGSRGSAPPPVEPKKTSENRVAIAPVAPSSTGLSTMPGREVPRNGSGIADESRTESARPDPPRRDPESSTRPPDPRPASRPIPDEDSLREAVRAYARAVSSGKREAVKRIFPEVSDKELREVDSLRQNFGLDRYGMNISIKDFEIEGAQARVKCTIFHNGIDNTGKPQQKRNNAELRFAWTGATWIRVR